MDSPADGKREWDLPHLKEIIELTQQVTAKGGKSENTISQLFDVKFYPYAKPGEDPVFAVLGNHHIFVCRPSSRKEKTTEILQCIIDEEKDVTNASLAWVKDLETGTPLLCVGGESATIKIINAVTGKLERALQGHGGYINNFAVSPLNPEILASASNDTTIRIWNLNKAHESQPLVALCAGNGHLDSILSIEFHSKGQYLLSAGEDHIVNLWTMPELPQKDEIPKKPVLIHYPHFSTSEVHSNYVDCAQFYNDLILSKALYENCIVLWAITGFDSSRPPPARSSAPTTHEHQHATRSAFWPPSKSPKSSTQYIRLLQFDLPGCYQFYMRFSLYSPLYYTSPSESPFPPPHPVLAICNSASKVLFWDLDRLCEYHVYTEAVDEYNASIVGSSKDGNKANDSIAIDDTSTSRNDKNAMKISPGTQASATPQRPSWLIPFRTRKTAKTGAKESRSYLMLDEDFLTTSSTVSQTTEPGENLALEVGWERKYSMADIKHPVGGSKNLLRRTASKGSKGKVGKGKVRGGMDELMGVEAHRSEVIPRFTVQGRQVAWSVGGEWCVVAGSPNIVSLFRRWEDLTGVTKGK